MDVLGEINLVWFKKKYINGNLKNLLVGKLIQSVINNMEIQNPSHDNIIGYFYSEVSVAIQIIALLHIFHYVGNNC